MTESLSVMDRLRIEWVVWSLDQRLYELPRKVRIAHRREVRENLQTAARDIGIGPALARLGNSYELAKEYLDAELGSRPRHSWMAAGLFAFTTQLLVTSWFFEAAAAYGDGVVAGDPNATGAFTWDGFPLVQTQVEYTFTDGAYSFVGGAWSPFAYVVWIIATILVGRLWRAVPAWQRMHEKRNERVDAV